MKKTSLVIALLCWSAIAFGYNSGTADPVDGYHDREFRTVVKSTTAGVSDAIGVGDVLSYDTTNNNDGYTVTRVGSNTGLGASKIACIAVQAIATGDTSQHRCISKGYVDFTNWSSTVAFSAGQKLCANTSGQAVTCGGVTLDGQSTGSDSSFGTATANSPITAASAKNAGLSGGGAITGQKVYINAR